jgi:hypothetical protein
VAISAAGDVIAVGASNGVYVFKRPDAGWAGAVSETAVLAPGSLEADDGFGYSVRMSAAGDVIVASAPGRQVGANGSQGQVYVFNRPGQGWVGRVPAAATLTASDGTSDDNLGGGWAPGFGSGVAISSAGDMIVAGAPNKNLGAGRRQGQAYVFPRPGATWSGALNESATLARSSGASGDDFGVASVIGPGGNWIAIGTPAYNSWGPAGVYVFTPGDFGWSGPITETSFLGTSQNGMPNIGEDVAAYGDTLLTRPGAGCTALALYDQPASGWPTGRMTETDNPPWSNGGGIGGVAIANGVLACGAYEYMWVDVDVSS